MTFQVEFGRILSEGRFMEVWAVLGRPTRDDEESDRKLFVSSRPAVSISRESWFLELVAS